MGAEHAFFVGMSWIAGLSVFMSCLGAYLVYRSSKQEQTKTNDAQEHQPQQEL